EGGARRFRAWLPSVRPRCGWLPNGVDPGVAEVVIGDRDELPGVAVRAQGELQDAERLIVARFAMWLDVDKVVQILAAGADDELAEATLIVALATRVHRGE